MGAEHAAALVCAWLATYFLHSSLLLGVAWLVTTRLPSRLDRLSELIWRAAVGLPILTSLAQHVTEGRIALGTGSVGAIQYTPQPLATSLVPAWAWIGGATIWIVTALVGVGHLLVCSIRFRRGIGHRTPLRLDRQRLVLPLLGRESVSISQIVDVSIPFALAGEICLPEWLVNRMSDVELRAVVAHELAHVHRRDAWWRPAISAVARSFFFQPLNWMAVSRLRELSECICDDEAIATLESPIPLAAALETVARRAKRRSGHAALAPAMGVPESLTLRRLGRILSRSGSAHFRLSPLQRVSGVLLACAITLMFAPRVSLPTTAFLRYTVNAEDPAGRFTVTVERGRVISATIAGRELERRQLKQDGALVQLVDRSSVLKLRMTPQGGIKWTARTPSGQ